MAATPQYGAMTFIGQSGRTYSKDIYVSDVNNALINWDTGNGAGSGTPTEFRLPENALLRDFAIVTGTADTEKIALTRNSIPTGNILRYVPHLTTNSQRPPLNLPFAQGDVLTAVQISD